jgi:hypothetical protein
MRSLVIVVVLTATADAEPPCLDFTKQPSVVGKDGKAIVCTGEPPACLVADPHADPSRADWPGNPPSTNGRYGRVDNKLAVCVGSTCKKVGDKLTKAAYRAQAEITTDLAVVVLERTEAWSVAADAPIALTKPTNAQTDKPIIHVAGKSLVTEWRDCADTMNCNGIAQITDTAGHNIGSPVPGGDVIVLDAHHAAVMGYGRTLTTFDTDTHAQLGHVAAMRDTGPLRQLAVGKIDDATVGVAWASTGLTTWRVAGFKAPATKAPSYSWVRNVAICGP